MLNNYNEKKYFFQHVVNDIQFAVKNYHLMNIINSNEYNICLDNLKKIIDLINNISNDNVINDLQYINNNLSSIIKNFDIFNFKNFLKICLGFEFENKYFKTDHLNKKFDVICKYLHPINYKILTWTDKN